jgi:hypothetical protein
MPRTSRRRIIARSWGRRLGDRARPVVVGAITSVLASAGTAGASYVWNQSAVQELNSYWQSYWRACGIKRE